MILPSPVPVGNIVYNAFKAVILIITRNSAKNLLTISPCLNYTDFVDIEGIYFQQIEVVKRLSTELFLMVFAKRSKLLLVLIVFLSVLIGVAAVWFFQRSGSRAEYVPNIILISIDTCRADYLSCYGYPRKVTPSIDGVADQAVRFEHAITPVPLTLPAHCSMLTGTIPPYHGVHGNTDYQLGGSNITLAEILHDHGYRTAAFVSAFVLDGKFGLDQGFDYYNDQFEEEHKYLQIAERRGQEVTRLTNAWLEQNRHERFFLFLHYFDPHADYRPPEPFASTFNNSPYAGEIAYADHCIGEVIEKLKELGVYDSSLIIITADHGEGLGEHSEGEHGFFIYQSTVRVPLIIKPPHCRKARKISAQAALLDIVPTVLGFLDIPTPSYLHGKDLCGYFESNNASIETRHIYCESLYPTIHGCNPLRGVVSDCWKYIWTSEPELYNLVQDPCELNNLVSEEKTRAGNLRNRLKHILAVQSHTEQLDSKLDLDAQSRARLESLGYVGGRMKDSLEPDSRKPDAKKFIDYHRLSRKYTLYLDRKQFDRAKKTCAEMLSQYENVTRTYYLWGYAAFMEGEMGEAVTNFAKYLQTNPDDPEGHYRLGLALARQNRHTEAVAHYRKALQSEPNDYMVHGNLGLSLSQIGKPDEAVKHFTEVLRLNPEDGDAHANIAVALVLQNKLDQAIIHYNKALQFKPNDSLVHINLGKALIHEGKIDEGILHWKEALRLEPNQPQVHDSLAKLLFSQGRTDEAVNHWNKSLSLAPNNYHIHYNLGLLLYKQGKIDQAVSHWNEALNLKPDQTQILNSLAWVLATLKDDRLRDPQKAVQLARRACELTDFARPSYLDTLAAAYAAAHNFPGAIRTAQKALNLATSENSQEMAREIEKRLTLYKASQVYLEEAAEIDDVKP